jgi:hypothetical protein
VLLVKYLPICHWLCCIGSLFSFFLSHSDILRPASAAAQAPLGANKFCRPWEAAGESGRRRAATNPSMVSSGRSQPLGSTGESRRGGLCWPRVDLVAARGGARRPRHPRRSSNHHAPGGEIWMASSNCRAPWQRDLTAPRASRARLPSSGALPRPTRTCPASSGSCAPSTFSPFGALLVVVLGLPRPGRRGLAIASLLTLQRKREGR